MKYVWLLFLLSVSGCGNDTDATNPKDTQSALVPTYAISGKAVNVRPGTVVVLRNNGGDDIAIPAGDNKFSFPARLAAGSRYRVSVASQSNQDCKVRRGAGKVANADIVNVVVKCSGKSYDQLASAPANFSDVLRLNDKFTVPEGGAIQNSSNVAKTIECIDQIESKKELRILNEKIKSERLANQLFDIKVNRSLASKTEQKAIFLSLSELKKCKALGDAWRNESYSPEIVSIINKSYSDMFALMTNLYAKKINYADYSNKTTQLHKEFDANVAAAIAQGIAQRTDTQKAKELELQQAAKNQQAEELRLLEELLKPAEEERKRLAEERRLAELALQAEKEKQEAQRKKDEAQRLADLEEEKKQQLENEREFQPLYQRHQIDRLK